MATVKSFILSASLLAVACGGVPAAIESSVVRISRDVCAEEKEQPSGLDPTLVAIDCVIAQAPLLVSAPPTDGGLGPSHARMVPVDPNAPHRHLVMARDAWEATP